MELAVAVGLLALHLLPHGGQAQVRAGAHGLYQSIGVDGNFGFGARVEADLDFLRSGLVLAGIWDEIRPDCDGCALTEVGGQVLMAPRGPLFLGLGAAYKRRSDDAGGDPAADPDVWRLYFAAGLRLRSIPVVQPYFEYRQEVASGALNYQTFVVGVLLSPVGRRSAPRRPFS